MEALEAYAGNVVAKAVADALAKAVANTVYHAAVITVIAAAYDKAWRLLFRGTAPRMEFTGRDLGLMTLDLTATLATRDLLVKHGLPADIFK